MEKRSNFSSRIGFVLAAAGSAVGLGNLWRFPYLAAKYGGGAFLLVYILFVLTFGFTLMIAETAIGRKTGLSAIGAYRKLNKKYSFVGVLASVVPMLILPYYSVIGGWVMKYLGGYLSGQHAAVSSNGFFDSFIAKSGEPLLWFGAFAMITFLVVLMGVTKGVEQVSKILMPVLIVLSILIAGYSITRPGALEGVKYFLIPNFKDFSLNTVLAALGQMFYSMSLSMGIMITYGSYMKKEDDLEKSVKQIELFDTGISVLAGLMIIPSVFVFSGGSKEALGQGPGLMFVTLPKVFESMGLSSVVGALFFLLVLFAALTSSISLMETVVSILCDKFKIKRAASCVLTLLIILLLGVPSSLGFGLWDGVKILGMSILDFFDFISNSILMPVAAMLTCIFVTYGIGVAAVKQEVKLSSKFTREKIFHGMIQYIAPICIAAILISSILNAFNIIHL